MTFDAIGEFDLDIVLKDYGTDHRLSPEQRMVANACIGVEPQDAYNSAAELRQAVDWTRKGEKRGERKLATILSTRCDDFQRCLYYCLAGRGADDMHDTLLWLEGVLEPRAKLGGKLIFERQPLADRREPYVAHEPDGPLPCSETLTFGASWGRRD